MLIVIRSSNMSNSQSNSIPIVVEVMWTLKYINSRDRSDFLYSRVLITRKSNQDLGSQTLSKSMVSNWYNLIIITDN